MKKVVFFCIGLWMVSCAEKVIEPPEKLISKDKMVEIYHDLALLKAAERNIEPILKHKGITIMEYLYDKHGIDSVQLTQSDLYYASVPLEYQAIYEEVNAILERRTKAMENATKQKNDSVRKTRKLMRDSTRGPRPTNKSTKTKGKIEAGKKTEKKVKENQT
ncbi:DUF4296 domain-containing protein [Flagellimonas myxillae]|uniref:DUF4296 domain-containing protein n=1 Tax=Flagellimonas myxillae TaxID=2942214 RepID=UPI00201ED37F|nr:DUF4296 domain-containing protein [Muricauda myxillae]MCL6267559.1 DUF4296 domain-containing protein [Muricauda myxillae]